MKDTKKRKLAGSLCIFSSVLDAVLCAKLVQEQLRKEPKVPLRIRLHLGDVIYEGNDIYGNALNIASRIESLGVAGSVLFSKNVQEKVRVCLKRKLNNSL